MYFVALRQAVLFSMNQSINQIWAKLTLYTSRIYSILVISHFEERSDPRVVDRDMTEQQADTEIFLG
jgi:hypothetical protein